MSKLEEIKLDIQDEYQFHNSINRDDVLWLISRVEKLEAALKFYADEKNYEDGRPGDQVYEYHEWDKGAKARAALSDSDEA